MKMGIRKARSRPNTLAVLSLLFVMAGGVLTNVGPARAHYLGESYLFLNVGPEAVSGHVDLPLAELDEVLFAGQMTDGILTSGEIGKNIGWIRSYVTDRVQIGTERAWYPLQFQKYEVMDNPNAPFVQLFFDLETAGETLDELRVRYSILFDTHALHRALLIVENNEIAGNSNPSERASLIFTRDTQVQELNLNDLSPFALFITYVEHGIFHIAVGFDHILFLVALLLSAVLNRENGHWIACDSFRGAFVNVVAIVTLFTVAHSITLALAALQIVTLPIRFVESMIALTVVVAAVHNLMPFIEKRIAIVVFLFGLFHGFGFADVLSGLGFRETSLVATLLGFNLGVELGQIMIVGAVFPILYLIRTQPLYRFAGLGAGSLVIAGLGVVWFTERALGF